MISLLRGRFRLDIGLRRHIGNNSALEFRFGRGIGQGPGNSLALASAQLGKRDINLPLDAVLCVVSAFAMSNATKQHEYSQPRYSGP